MDVLKAREEALFALVFQATLLAGAIEDGDVTVAPRAARRAARFVAAVGRFNETDRAAFAVQSDPRSREVLRRINESTGRVYETPAHTAYLTATGAVRWVRNS
jgi:hypothetical protein